MRAICAVYLLSNFKRTVIYTGVSSDLIRRVIEHKEGNIPGFTKRYHVHDLVYFEEFTDIRDAIAREKQIKAGSRKKKEELIRSMNPEWKDLFEELL